MTQRVIVFAKLPPPHTGQTIATSKAVNTLNNEYSLTVIDTSAGEIKPEDSAIRWLQYIFQLVGGLAINYARLVKCLPGADITYVVLSPSFGGQLRNVVSLSISKLLRTATVGHIHNRDYDTDSISIPHASLRGVVTRLVDGAIVLSEGFKTDFKGLFPHATISVVTNTVDAGVLFTNKELRKHIRTRENAKRATILIVANLLPGKGHVTVVEGLARMWPSWQRWQLHIVGDTTHNREYNRLVSALREAPFGMDQVDIHGAVTSRSAMKRLYSQSHMLVLPTSYDKEAQPKSIIEALNAGVPVVATKHADIPNMISSGSEGILTDKDPSAVGYAMYEIFEGNKPWTAFSYAARQRFKRDFSPKANRAALLNAFADLDCQGPTSE